MNTGKHKGTEMDELKKLAPTLFGMEKKDCFSVPENYFSVLPEKIQQLTLNSKVQQVFNVPDGYFDQFPHRMEQLLMKDRKHVFEAPEGYFDDLASRIQDRIHQKEKKAWNWRPTVKWSLAMVTTCLALYVGSTFFTSENLQKARPLSSNEIRQTLDKQLNSIDESVLLEQVEVEDIEAAGNAARDENSEEITNYLIDNNIDVNSIVNEL